MKSTKLILSLCLLLLASTALSVRAQDSEYQTAKIVGVEKLESSTTGGGSDAPSAPNQNRFNMSIQVGDSVYVCRVKTSSDMDLDWAKNKEIQAKKDGK